MRTTTEHIAWQGSLFADHIQRERLSFDRLRRDELPGGAWLDLVSGWLPEHEELFSWLLEHAGARMSITLRHSR